jgi:imidazolonepropionase
MRELSVVKNGAVAIKDGRIVACGPTARVERETLAEKTLDVSGKIVMPGFVDPHTHPVFVGTREQELTTKIEGKSYMEILRSGGGILRSVRETRRATKQQLLEATLGHIREMLLQGTTTIEVKSGYGLTPRDEIKSLEVARELERHVPVSVVPTFLGAHAIPQEYAGKPEDYVTLIVEEMIPEIAGRKLAKFCDVFCEQGVFSGEQSKRILQAAKVLGLKLKVHADEFSDTGGAALAAELGATSADHLLKSSPENLRKLANAGGIGVVLPGAPLTLLIDDRPDARGMIEMGLPVAIGTDFSPSCWMPSQQLPIGLACNMLRITPAEAITATTVNAAFAVEMQNEVGSIVPGKHADMLILDAPNHQHLGYRLGVNLVERVIKDGNVVVEDGRIVSS